MRLASGIAPVPALQAAGARVGLAVDGSASNDSGNLLREAQAALFVHRLPGGAGAMTARGALRLATRGGAELLGRDDVGSIEPGKRADLALYRLDDMGFAGARHDPVAALLFCCGAMRAETVVVEGRVVVEGGRLATADQDEIAREGDRCSRSLLGLPAASR
jgi:cytosine/adenosine deaminase-related metal-dependent hydrolase